MVERYVAREIYNVISSSAVVSRPNQDLPVHRSITARRSHAPLTPERCEHHSTCGPGADPTHAARLGSWT